MPTLEQSIRQLRREILASLTEAAPLPNGVSLVADRVSVSLAVQWDPNGTGIQASGFGVAMDAATALHHLNFEFRVESTAPPDQPPAPASLSPALPLRADPGVEDPVLAALSAILGAPGFDSSARATVFREVLEALSGEQRRRVLATLGEKPSPEEETAVTQARHRLQRLAGSGPAGRDRGPELLRQLAETHAVDTLMQLAAERWRTQSEWAAESGTETGV